MSKKPKRPPCGDILCEARLEIPTLVEKVGMLSFNLQDAMNFMNDSMSDHDLPHRQALVSCDDSRKCIAAIEKTLREIREKITTFVRWSK